MAGVAPWPSGNLPGGPVPAISPALRRHHCSVAMRRQRHNPVAVGHNAHALRFGEARDVSTPGGETLA